MNQEYIAIQPEYVGKFQCDGLACKAMCCQNWHIDIDDQTLKKYKKIADVHLKKQILSAIKKTKKRKMHEIILNEQGKCPLLCSDNLCTIHRTLGEEYLSNTCATYPRRVKEINGYLLQNLDLSCPVAARLALLNEEPMGFEQVKTTQIRPVSLKLDTQKFSLETPLLKYFIDLQMFIISVMQNRKFTIDERLIIIGIFLDRIDELTQLAQSDQIPELITYYHELIDSSEITRLIQTIQPNIKEKLTLNFSLVDHLCNIGITNAIKIYTDILIDVFQLKSENDVYSLIKIHQENEVYIRPFWEKYSYVMEHYLINFIVQNAFPLTPNRSLSKNFILLIVFFSLKQFLFFPAAVQRKQKLTIEDFLMFMCAFSRIEANTTYIRDLATKIEKQNKDIFYYMSTCLR